MADGKVQLYGGKVLRDGGLVAIADACCCGTLIYRLAPCVESADPPHCDDCEAGTTPKFLTVVVSDLNPSTDCYNYAHSHSAKMTGDPFSATWVLDHDGGCWWSDTQAIAAEWISYTSNDCDDGLAHIHYALDTATMFAYWDFDDAGGKLLWGTMSGGGAGDYAFYDEQAGGGECDQAHVFTNELAGPLNGFPYGGTALVTPGDIYGAGKCTGGDPIFTDGDLSAYVGKVVELDDGKCYEVSVETEGNPSDGGVTVVAWADDCEDCCDEAGTCTVL